MYYVKEIAEGEFVRSFSLPALVDKDSLKAHFDNGILKNEIPKLSGKKGT